MRIAILVLLTLLAAGLASAEDSRLEVEPGQKSTWRPGIWPTVPRQSD